jgi:hypothetical protein
MKNVQVQANYNRNTNKFSVNIKEGSKESVQNFDNAGQVEKYVKDQAGVDISYNHQQDRFEIPVQNQFDF